MSRRRTRQRSALELREALGEVLAQHVAHPGALVLRGEAEAREQLLLARVGSLPRSPAHGEALEQELDRALPGVLPRQRRGGERRGVLAPRRGRQRAAQLETSRPRAYSAGGGELSWGAAAALAHTAAARSSCAATSPVTGSAWPGHAAGAQRGQLAQRGARLLGVVVERDGHARRTSRPVRTRARRRRRPQREAVALAPQRDVPRSVARHVRRPGSRMVVAVLERVGDRHGPGVHIPSRHGRSAWRKASRRSGSWRRPPSPSASSFSASSAEHGDAEVGRPAAVVGVPMAEHHPRDPAQRAGRRPGRARHRLDPVSKASTPSPSGRISHTLKPPRHGTAADHPTRRRRPARRRTP